MVAGVVIGVDKEVREVATEVVAEDGVAPSLSGVRCRSRSAELHEHRGDGH